MDALRNDDIKDYYDRQVGALNGAYEADRWHASPVKKFEYRQTVRSLKAALGSRKYERAIEVGPGDAVFTPLIRERVTGPIHLIEQSEAMLASAKGKLAAMPSISFERADFETSVPPFEADLIVASRCFEYFAHKDRAMAHFAKLLAPGGRLVVITKNPRMVTGKSARARAMHGDQVSPRKFRQLAEASGLTVETAFPAVIRWKASWSVMRALFDGIHRLGVLSNGWFYLPFITPYATESYAYVIGRAPEARRES